MASSTQVKGSSLIVRVPAEEMLSHPTAAPRAGDTRLHRPLLRFPLSLPQEGEVTGAHDNPRQHVQRTIPPLPTAVLGMLQGLTTHMPTYGAVLGSPRGMFSP